MKPQADLFDLEEGRRRRDAGQLLVASCRTASEWQYRAGSLLLSLRLGDEFTADDVVAFAGLPPARNLVGATFSAWAKEGKVLNTGLYVKSKRAGRNAGRNAVWRVLR